MNRALTPGKLQQTLDMLPKKSHMPCGVRVREPACATDAALQVQSAVNETTCEHQLIYQQQVWGMQH